jgi:hypothetical protein
MAGGGLGAQSAFASLAGVKMAPALAYSQISGDSGQEVAALFENSAATLLLLSSAWQGPAGHALEGGALVLLQDSQFNYLRQAHAAVMASPRAFVVLDAGYDSGEASGRAQELVDADFLEALLENS